MTCSELGLGPNETLEYRAHLHWLYKVGAWSVLVLLLAVAAAAYAGAYHVLAGVASITSGILFVAIMLPVWTTEIGVTNQRLIYKRGFVRRRSDEFQLRAIEGVQMIGELANNEGIYVDLKAFKIAKGAAKGDPSTQIAKMGAREVADGAIIFRFGDKLYIVDGKPAGSAP